MGLPSASVFEGSEGLKLRLEELRVVRNRQHRLARLALGAPQFALEGDATAAMIPEDRRDPVRPRSAEELDGLAEQLPFRRSTGTARRRSELARRDSPEGRRSEPPRGQDPDEEDVQEDRATEKNA